MPDNATVARRFWSKVARLGADECWPWLAFRDRDGYGRFSIGGTDMSAQRAAWALTSGEIPKGLHVLHDCDNPPCCNPAHLFLGTHADNMKDSARKKRKKWHGKRGAESPLGSLTHCKRGHLYDDANTRLDSRGHRVCRECMRANTARWRLKHSGPAGEHYNRAKTHCVHGHPFDQANTYWHRGYRCCRTCSNNRHKARSRARVQRNKG